MRPILIYCYDAYCGWCYGFSPVIRKIAQEYKDRLDMEVLSGGMMTGEGIMPIEKIGPFIQTSYKSVEDLTGIKFGEDFLWHVFNPEQSDWVMNSEKPAIALCIFKEYYPERQLEFATDLQYALNYEGRDLDDDEAYRHLLEKYSIQPEAFYAKLKSEAYKEAAYYEFALCKQLQVNGFPSVFIQTGELKFVMVARGFTALEELSSRIEMVLKEPAA
ncbi:MAG: DsbA family protein [Ferruginibacter sp.]|nr:DsbA family protein [Chitinophagaceae bacterium]MBP6285696.1 DsbA family protein [Ferruginibacter sp.]MBU9936352.1 DsbA family protein [Ferruginibacter sp.]